MKRPGSGRDAQQEYPCSPKIGVTALQRWIEIKPTFPQLAHNFR
jgi:hypothetical protein